MSFSGNYICTRYKLGLLEAKHNFRSGGHTFKVALYDDNASFTASTTDYTTTDEVSGTGYSAGGGTLTLVPAAESGTGAFASFANFTFTNVTLTTHGAIIYNTTTDDGSNTTDAIMILDFGRNLVKSGADLVVIMPSADMLNAIVRAQ
jgi:hypothetical protein